jgi:polar amino acid transport system permease protein
MDSNLISGLVAYWNSIAGYMPGFLEASWVAFEVTVFVIVVSWVSGLILALGKFSERRLFNWPATFYVWFIRGTPTLVQIFIIYFGLPQIGVKMSPFVAGVVALGFNSGAYVAEIIRGGLLAIPKGQMESALAIGMSPAQAMFRIILPQVVRIIIPPITNEAATSLKNTSLLSAITLVELTLYAQMIIAATYRPFDFYIIAALLYLVLTTVLTQLSAWFERRYRLVY